MKNLLAKKILIIDLDKQNFDIQSSFDLSKYFGGVCLGTKLLTNFLKYQPIIFSVGPFNGFFPFASKTSIVLNVGTNIEDIYLGGSISFRIKFAGYDSIVIINVSKNNVVLDIDNEKVIFRDPTENIDGLGLPGKRAVISKSKFSGEYKLDNYFTTPENFLQNELTEKKVIGISITGSNVYEIKNKDRYNELYKHLLDRTNELTAIKSNKPSCSGCPIGCEQSQKGEMGGNVLVHSLVGCNFAEKIYSDVSIVFSCLNTLGYDYTHEDIENLPGLFNNTLKELL